MIFQTCLTVLVLISVKVEATGFVEEVACSSQSFTVVLNKTDPDIYRWMQNSESRPVVYVYGFKPRTPCGMALKGANGGKTYNFTVPYGPSCGVHLTDLEPNYQTAETTIAIEDNNVTNPSKPMRINHVFCLYTRRVQTLRINDISTGHEVVASTGGKPKPKVDMHFRGIDGKPLKAAKFGDTVGLYLALAPDNAYKAIAPKQCMFSDQDKMEVPGAQTLTFVQSNCPVQELSEIIEPLQDVNEEVYFTKFQTFRFGTKNTVYAHCSVKVCLTQAECASNCFNRIENSSLTAENLRLRFKRENTHSKTIPSHDARVKRQSVQESEVAISNALTILDEEEYFEVVGKDYEMCLNKNLINIFYLIMGILGFLFLFSLCLICCLARKLKIQTKKYETEHLCESVDTSIYGGSVSRRIPALSFHSDRGYPASSVNSETVRSLSEVTGPSSAWIGSFQEHNIPRVQKIM